MLGPKQGMGGERVSVEAGAGLAPILIEIADGIALLTLNEPPLNLVTRAMTAELEAALDRLAADPEARVMVVTGAGERAFCVGSDIAEFPDVADAVVEKKMRAETRTWSKLATFPKPTIAAIRGAALGGGLELAVCCDLLVAEEDSRLALPEVKLGVFPGAGGTYRVTRRIGAGRAKEMMFLGEPVDARRALEWGLVNRVVPRGEALNEAMALARTLAALPGQALQVCKEAIGFALDLPEDAALERGLELIERVFATDDCKEGVRAFFARETPRFTHR